MINKTFGLLTVKERSGSKNRRALWLCQCECGNTTEVTTDKLNNGHTKSCGCLRVTLKETHGHSKHPSYISWKAMIDRCNNPSHIHYARYGGRGITVCDRWFDLDNFIADMGERPKGYSLERIDNEKGYSPDNCRWATAKEQANNRSNNKVVMGKTLSHWAENLGCSPEVISDRLKRGWDEQEAVTKPVAHNNEFTFRGVTKNVRQWSLTTGIPYTTLVYRFKCGLSPDQILKEVAA